MRRKDREVTDKNQILDIIARCPVGRVAFTDSQGAFIVPVHMGYAWEEKLTLYFHSAPEGRKMSALTAHPQVFVEMDIHHGLQESANACGYSAYFESVMGTGQAALVEETEEKKKALNLLMRCQTGKDFVFADKDVERVAVVKIVADSVTAKRRLKED